MNLKKLSISVIFFLTLSSYFLNIHAKIFATDEIYLRFMDITTNAIKEDEDKQIYFWNRYLIYDDAIANVRASIRDSKEFSSAKVKVLQLIMMEICVYYHDDSKYNLRYRESQVIAESDDYHELLKNLESLRNISLCNYIFEVGICNNIFNESAVYIMLSKLKDNLPEDIDAHSYFGNRVDIYSNAILIFQTYPEVKREKFDFIRNFILEFIVKGIQKSYPEGFKYYYNFSYQESQIIASARNWEELLKYLTFMRASALVLSI